MYVSILVVNGRNVPVKEEENATANTDVNNAGLEIFKMLKDALENTLNVAFMRLNCKL